MTDQDNIYQLGEGEYHPLSNPELDEWEQAVFGRLDAAVLPTQDELDEFQQAHRDCGPLAGNAPMNAEE